MTLTLFRWTAILSPANPEVAQDCGKVFAAGFGPTKFCPGTDIGPTLCPPSVDALYDITEQFSLYKPLEWYAQTTYTNT